MSNIDEDLSLDFEGIVKANENDGRWAQDVVDGPQKERTTQDYLDARRQDLRDRIGKSLDLDSGDGRVIKEVDELEPPSFDLEAAEKSEAEKTGEKIGDAVAKRIEDALSEAESPDSGDTRETVSKDDNVVETVEKNADKVDAITSTLLRYLDDGGSLRDGVDDFENWAEDLPGADA